MPGSSVSGTTHFYPNSSPTTLKSIADPCIVTSTDVRTSDNVTYSYSPAQCWTLTSAKCSPDPEYAVFTKRSSSGLPLEAVVYVGGHKVEFNVQGNSVKMSVNGSPIDLQPGEQKLHKEGSTEIFK